MSETVQGELIDEDEDIGGDLVLVFSAEGQCSLEEDGEVVWMSDADDDFAETFSDDFLEAEADAGEVLDWLVDEGWLEPEEKASVAVETEVDDIDE